MGALDQIVGACVGRRVPGAGTGSATRVVGCNFARVTMIVALGLA